MTDFNYSEFPIEVLENAIERCEDDIRKIQNTVKRYNKNLTLNNGRGYSNKRKDIFKSYIKYAPALIANHEQEIAECKADIASRS